MPNPYLRHVQRAFLDVKRFPHRMASEYPEEWLCRILEALKVWLADRKEGTIHDWEYTHQYAATYVDVAQVALKETMAERVKFLQETAVLPDEEGRAKLYAALERLNAETEAKHGREIAQLNEKIVILRSENELLSKLVTARSRVAFERAAHSVEALAPGAGPPAEPKVGVVKKVKVLQGRVVRPSGGLVATTTPLKIRSFQMKEARQVPEKKLADHLADLDRHVPRPDQGSSDSSSQSSEASPERQEKG